MGRTSLSKSSLHYESDCDVSDIMRYEKEETSERN